MTTDGSSLLRTLLADLDAETIDLVDLLETLSPGEWTLPTPAAGWSVRDQVTHLAYFDDAALLSMRDPVAFAALRDELMGLGEGFPDVVAEQHRTLEPSACLEWLTRSRLSLLAAYAVEDPATRLPWFGPSMGLASSVTARLMETWAHGQDIADTLAVIRPPTRQLRHIADLGVRTRGFSYALRGLQVPETPVRVELVGPQEQSWEWGPVDAADRVTGEALDFCLIVTQRRHVDDTDLSIVGSAAAEWMSLAQAFAGGVGSGRTAGRRPPS